MQINLHCDDSLTAYLIIGQFANSFDVHIRVSDKPFQFRELRCVVVSDKLQRKMQDQINTCKIAAQNNR
jgi:hypothetical protein